MSILKQIRVTDGNGNVAQDGELLVYSVTFDGSGVPTRGSLVSTLADATGATIDQSIDPLLSDPTGLLEFMLPAGVYWVEVTRGPVTTTFKRYQVGDASERAVGTGANDLPDGEALLESLIGAEPTGADVGKVIRYGASGVELAFPDPSPAFAVEELTGSISTSLIGRMQRVTEDTALNLPSEGGLSFPVGRALTFLVEGAPGTPVTLTLNPGAGATINGGSDSWACDVEYAVVTTFKTGADSWAVQGCERLE